MSAAPPRRFNAAAASATRRLLVNAASVVLALALCAPSPARADFHRGDLVPTSRRAQFHGERTAWHDLLATHCPTFDRDGVVAVPLPRPTNLSDDDAYKIRLSFDSDRHHTDWMTVIPEKKVSAASKKNTKNAAKKTRGRTPRGDDDEDAEEDGTATTDAEEPPVPMIDVAFYVDDGRVVAVAAQVVPLPRAYLREHRALVAEHHDRGAWPKHVIVRYRWKKRFRVDVNGGAGIGLTLCLVATAALGFGAARDARRGGSIAAFVHVLESAVGPGGDGEGDGEGGGGGFGRKFD